MHIFVCPSRHFWYSKFNMKNWNRCSEVIKIMEQRAVIRFFCSRGARNQRARQNLGQCMGQKHSLYQQWRSGANAFRNEERPHGSSKVGKAHDTGSCWVKSVNAFRTTIDVVQGSGLAPLHWKGDMLANRSQWLRVDEIPSSLDSTHTHDRPEERTGKLFKATSGHARTTVANGLWICYTRRWVLVLFGQSSRRSLDSIQRWTSRHGKVSDVGIMAP
jgi:hypothetical protein